MEYKDRILNSHFSFSEFIESQTADDNHIINTPTANALLNIGILVNEVLDPIRLNFGPVKIISGYRCRELNTLVGGSKTSAHMKGEAADIKVPGTKLITVINWINQNLNFREMIAEYLPNGWIHISYRFGSNIKIIKIKDQNHNYDVVTIEYLNNLYGENLEY